MSAIIDAPPYQRTYLPNDLVVSSWDDVKPFADELKAREWANGDDYYAWLKDWDEVNIVMSERYARLYIDKSCNTENEKMQKDFLDWATKTIPEQTVFENDMNKRFVASPFADRIKDAGFPLLMKRSKASIDLFREANVPLLAADIELANEYGEVAGAQMVMIDGVEKTLAQAGTALEGADRTKREAAWRAIAERRLQDKDKLDDIYDRMVANRHQIARNAGEKNYRDYKFKEYQRFDYTPEDCYKFHEAIEKAVMPIVKKMEQKRADDMGLVTLRPWDYGCDPKGRPAIVAFSDSKEMIDKTILMLDNTVPVAADTLRRMQKLGLLDLDSRKGKEPGGYNTGLPETRSSFMFTNQTGTVRDMETAVHEGGHATHDLLSARQGLYAYQSYPMELAEVASMSLELLTHDQWSVFFKDPETLARAQYKHLSSIVQFFPMMASIDAFQHAVYENPTMSKEQRHDTWDGIQKRFGNEELVDRSGLSDEYRRTGWQRILHIYEVPFYYIEYGISQLGALQMWRNYKENKETAVKGYENFLSLGYTRSVPDTYAAGGIKFDFSVNMIEDLMGFVGDEMDKIVKSSASPIIS